MSSLEAAPYAYSRDDWQCLKTDMSYEASKYQIDLIATKLHMRSLEESSEPPIRHLLVHPGIAESNMSKDLVFSIIEYLKLAIFYFVSDIGHVSFSDIGLSFVRFGGVGHQIILSLRSPLRSLQCISVSSQSYVSPHG